MRIPESQLAKLQVFGYTEVEARFLHIAATHSGYFTLRQFLWFAKASYGKRNARFAEKLFALGHASIQRYRRNGRVYHLDCRQIYAAIGKYYLRRRRKHELRYVRTRLLGLDFMLAHSEESVKFQIDQYAEFIQSTPSYVITEALKLLFRRDEQFKHWLNQHPTNVRGQKIEGGVLTKTA